MGPDVHIQLTAARDDQPPQVFVTAHQSVEVTSAKMYAALKRRNYVTPTNYLETVSYYGHKQFTLPGAIWTGVA
jgi:hypothetical protein